MIYYFTKGKRKTQGFQTFEDAEKGANDIIRDLSKGNEQALTLTKSDLHIYQRATGALPEGVDLDTAVLDYADAVMRLGAVGLRAAVEGYLRHHAKELPKKSVAEVL